MAVDAETIYATVFAIVSSVGAALGGQKVIDKRKQANTQPVPSDFCTEHHKCFEEIKDAIGDVKSDVAYIRGVIDRGLK